MYINVYSKCVVLKWISGVAKPLGIAITSCSSKWKEMKPLHKQSVLFIGKTQPSAKPYLEPCQTSKIERFAKLLTSFKC